MINILSIETATNACSAALLIENKVFSRFSIAPRQQSKLILPMIQEILEEAEASLSAIHALAVGCGPGSFMGIRLAVGIAQGLAFGLKIPVIPISTLQILAQTAYEKTGTAQVLVGWDARMNDIYWGVYALDTFGIMQAAQSDCVSRPDQIDVSQKITYIPAGNAWSVYKDQLPPMLTALLDNRYTMLYPEAQSMLTTAFSYYQQGKTVSPECLEPQYLRHQVAHRK